MTVSPLAPALAARALAGMEGLDPRGLATADDIAGMCEGGQCFRLAGAVDAVYVVVVKNGVAWVDAAAGKGGADCTQAIDAALTSQAAGLKALAMQTKRRGLVKKLEKLGWRVSGWVMRKDLQ